jgi:iron complex transport system substrate-binding protein
MAPDLVLAWQSGNPAREVNRLERAGWSVAVTEVRTLDDIPRLVRWVGHIAGTGSFAGQAADAMDRRLRALVVPGDRRPLPVFVEIWPRPLMTVNGTHLISDVLRRCGARNVFASARALTFFVSREQLLAAAPRALIVGDAESASQVAGASIIAIDPRQMHSQGPRLIDVAEHLCERLAS